MVAAKNNKPQMTQRKFPTRVPTADTAAAIDPVAVAAADRGGATINSDLGRDVDFTTVVASFIVFSPALCPTNFSLSLVALLPSNSSNDRKATHDKLKFVGHY